MASLRNQELTAGWPTDIAFWRVMIAMMRIDIIVQCIDNRFTAWGMFFVFSLFGKGLCHSVVSFFTILLFSE